MMVFHVEPAAERAGCYEQTDKWRRVWYKYIYLRPEREWQRLLRDGNPVNLSSSVMSVKNTRSPMKTTVKSEHARPRSGPPRISVDDESVTYAGLRPRMKWGTGRVIRHFGSRSPRWSAQHDPGALTDAALRHRTKSFLLHEHRVDRLQRRYAAT